MQHSEKQIYKNTAFLRSLSYKIFLAVFIIFSVAAITALRHNNETMINLRAGVYAADKSGAGVEPALDKLRGYVYAHMNTDLSSGGNAINPPIQLKYTYERLEAQAQASANNTGLYTSAEDYCQAQVPTGFSGRYRISCVSDYIMNHGGQAAQAIPAALYEFDFVSPTWSPDLAGWSLVLSGLSLVGAITSFLIVRLNYRRK